MKNTGNETQLITQENTKYLTKKLAIMDCDKN